mmetsp:Transcript_22734/g.67696  ORF Transcript_22734/g.67696 Transcript_22734/m.67696 type:complete len:97 (-) Transcript_22734:168-458(-)
MWSATDDPPVAANLSPSSAEPRGGVRHAETAAVEAAAVEAAAVESVVAEATAVDMVAVAAAAAAVSLASRSARLAGAKSSALTAWSVGLAVWRICR